ncbi:uncharacterized protein [Musca autumnalis]|uniref:uncharacterized protein n=1 Tax=Musca autumnalis TaxID=221902 RepID=UPI003CFA3AAC
MTTQRKGCCLAAIIAFLILSTEASGEANQKNITEIMGSYVYNLQERVNSMKHDVTTLNTSSKKIINSLEGIKTQIAEDSSICDQIDVDMDALVTKVKTIQDEQTKQLDNLLDKQQKYIENCNKTKSESSVLSELLADINGRANKFEEQLAKIDSVLDQEMQKQSTEVNNQQMKLLDDIDAKLSANQEKIANYENQIPALLELVQSINEVLFRKPHKIPFDKILALN